MRRYLLATTLVVTSLIIAHRSLAQSGPGGFGPGDGDAVLKDPFAAPHPGVTPPVPKTPNYGGAAPFLEPFPLPDQKATTDKFGSIVPPKDMPDPNSGIHVTKEQGAWMIMIQTYRGPEASTMAREMVMELRSAYKLKAYTFNFSTEERQVEFERVKALIEQQKEFLKKNGMPLDHPIRVKHVRVEDNEAVLVGGFPTEDAARREADRIRKAKPPNPEKVKLDSKYIVSEADVRKKLEETKERVYVNPFLRCCVVRNPAIKADRPVAKEDKLDMDVLKKLNAGEKYSLLTCKKPVTLAIKQFQTPTVVQSKDVTTNIFAKITGKGKAKVDEAMKDAHNLAEILRKQNLDAYVLHTEYASVVTVGGFDDLQDPSLRSMQNVLEGVAQRWPAVAMFPRALPMEVPRENKK